MAGRTTTHQDANDWGAIFTVVVAGFLGLAVGGGAMKIATDSIIQSVRLPISPPVRHLSPARPVREPALASLAVVGDRSQSTDWVEKAIGEEW